jgi:hypothetical protein
MRPCANTPAEELDPLILFEYVFESKIKDRDGH